MIRVLLAVASLAAADDGYFEWNLGDKAVLFGYQKDGTVGTVPCLTDYFAWQEWEKLVDAKDELGHTLMVRKGSLAYLDSGTKVALIKFHEGHTFTGTLVRDCWEIRVQDGPHEGKLFRVLSDDLRPIVTVLGEGITVSKPGPEGYGEAIAASDKLIFKEIIGAAGSEIAKLANMPKRNARLARMRNRRIMEQAVRIGNRYERSDEEVLMILDYGNQYNWPWDKAKLQPKVAKPAGSRAAGQLRIAQGLEKSNKPAALKQYKSIVRDFPDTPEAKAAADWLKANDKPPTKKAA